MVLPFLTQIIVFFLTFEDDDESGELVGLDEAMGVGDWGAIGELEGVGVGDGMTISATVFVGDGVGVALVTATGASVGNKSLS